MNLPVLQKLKAAFSFFRPRLLEDLYCLKVLRSGRFDKDFYRGVNQELNVVYRAFPIRHFVRIGEKHGAQPNPEFSPKAYLQLNHDLAGGAIAPFLHYVQIGHAEGRPTNNLHGCPTAENIPIPDVRSISAAQNKQRSRFAVHAHIFYHDIWEEFVEKLSNTDIDLDLYVTITHFGARSVRLRERVLDTFPTAFVVLVPNLGRDIFPFVHLVNAGVFAYYDAVCKIHTKKSPHRQDGDEWRNHLVDGVLRGPNMGRDLDLFLSETSASLWVADGQHYTDPVWWGSNFEKTAQLLRRVEINAVFDHLSFPAGSIYWLKPAVLDGIRGLSLTEFDFDLEMGQVDGTLAHAFERALGYIAEDGARKIVQTSLLSAPSETPMPARKPNLVSAFYLPQFHRTSENDKWWGKGYTEWVAASRALPNFDGHQHPQFPSDLGFYDLQNPTVLGEQAKLAKDAGIDAFCTYFYWFDGQRILEKPIDNLMMSSDIDFPFYFCWANESWRRNWDGLSGEILLHQQYLEGFEAKLAKDTAPYMKDSRYQRPDGIRPRFMIYRPDDMPDPERSVKRLRKAWFDEGIGDVELGAVIFHVKDENSAHSNLFDFWVEMPPHGLINTDDYLVGGPQPSDVELAPRNGFGGLVYDYRAMIRSSLDEDYVSALPENTIAGIMPSWDNTARRGLNAHIAWGANPMTFDHWLEKVSKQRIDGSYNGELFINAWNEWAEKAMLEPSRQYGDAYLRVVSKWT